MVHAGVADGVGGWHSYGVEPSHFSRKLMACCSKMATLHLEQPRDILKRGFEELLRVHSKTYGNELITFHDKSWEAELHYRLSLS